MVEYRPTPAAETKETLEERIDKIQKQIDALVKERERLKSHGST